MASFSSVSLSSMFFPDPPESMLELGVPDVFVENLILKWVLAKGSIPGQQLAYCLGIPFNLLDDKLYSMKKRLLLQINGSTGIQDFNYELTDEGKAKAIAARNESSYIGPLPVSLPDYLNSVKRQSIRVESPTEQRLNEAFSDILIPDDLMDTLGPAVCSGKGLFLYGLPGNGKTTIAERIAHAYQMNIYIPKVLFIDGQVIKLYDAQCHKLGETPRDLSMDMRWVCIQRPAIVVGGELEMSSLDVKFNPTLNISEAPLQLKANGGVFLIDDFGRQQIPPEALLNRWIIPLEKQIDYLTLSSGQKIEVPFDTFIIFSTNLDPADLVDEAFLRRIPYKVNVPDPSPEMFKSLFEMMAKKLNIPFDEGAYQYLVEQHYHGKRPFRACQPRDLLLQVMNRAQYQSVTPLMTPQAFDAACQTYFSAMGKA